MLLLPNAEAAIVVLTSTLSLNDTPDWVSQLVLEEVLEVPEKNDYVAAAKAMSPKMPSGTRAPSRNSEQASRRYITEEARGLYWDLLGCNPWCEKIEVSIEDDTPYWALQRLPSEQFSFDHYENDTFIFLRPRNELAKRGRWVDQGAEFWKLRFQANNDGQIEKVFWIHDIGVPAVE